MIRGDKSDKAEFVQVATGITGTTDSEVISGLKDGDQIVTGSYRVLRTEEWWPRSRLTTGPR